MAVRNIFRYKRRSLITSIAIAVGVMFTIMIDGLLVGSENESARNIQEYETGDAKIYQTGYFKERRFLPYTIFLEPADRKAIETALSKYPLAPRVELSGDIYFNEDFFAVAGSVTAKISAVDPQKDALVFKTAKTVTDGRWLKNGDQGVVLGSWIAEDIGAKVGYTISIECRGRGGFYQTFDAEIIGIVTTDDPYINRSSVFMDLSHADDLFALNGAVTEYSVRIDSTEPLDRKIAKLKKAVPAYADNLYSWEMLAADAIQLTKAKSGGSKLYLFFMFIIAAVGISNTMLMAVMERKQEIGMLRSLGYTTFKIRFLFLIEGFGIGFIGSCFGLIGGVLVNLYMTTYGLDFSFMLRNMDAGYRLTGVMRSMWNLKGMAVAVVGALAISSLMAWFPSGKILKSEVAEILRK